MWTWTSEHLHLQSAEYYPRTPCSMIFCSHFSFFPSPLDLVLGTVFVSVPLKNMYKRKLALAALAQNCLSYLFKVLYTIHIGNTRPRHYTPEIQVP